MSEFDSVWQRIVGMRGQTFHTTTGRPFCYDISGGTVVLRNTNRMLRRGQFARAFDRMRAALGLTTRQFSPDKTSFIHGHN
jgi:hypothetical protein